MNKISIIVKSVVIAMGMVGIVYADNDSSHYALNTWTGFYAGVNAGVVFNDVQLKSQQLGFTNPSEKCNTSSNFSSFSPGLQVGYMYEFPNTFVSAIEANVAFNTNQKDTLSCTCVDNPDVSDRFIFRNQIQSSIKALMGSPVTWNQNILLPYVTVGASFANVALTYKNEGGDYYSKNTTQAGWLVGAGIEWAFMQIWSVRAEYYYANYGNAINLKIPSVYGLIDPNGNAQADLSSNNIAVTLAVKVLS